VTRAVFVYDEDLMFETVSAFTYAALMGVVNSVTPSKIESIWAPVTAIQLAESVVVALG
jgi:hypothetical protein